MGKNCIASSTHTHIKYLIVR